MAITLAEVQKNVQDDLQMGIIDEFRKSSWLLDNLTFDDVVSPTGGGSTFTYGYTRLITQPTASFRAINSEYVKSNISKQRYTADLKVFGGAFEIDRVLNRFGGIIQSETELQIQQKVKAAQALFNDTVINGDIGTDANSFDGLDKAITGSSTEYNATGTAIDLSTSAAIDSNYKIFLDALDEFLSNLDGRPSFLGGNTKLITKIKAVARRSSAYQQTMDSFGNQISTYDGIPLIDFGAKPGSNNNVVGTNATSGETSLYAARLGLDGFHAISMTGNAPVQIWMPDFSTAGAVKTGEVEMIAATVLKATKAAAVFRKLKVK